jgi:hypothetical protein
VDGCPNCTRLERLLYASINSQAAAATAAGLGAVGVPPAAAGVLADVAGDVAAKEAVKAKRKGQRKASAYAKRYGRCYRQIKKAKTLKSGKMAKGYGGKRGHARIVKEAHRCAKKGGKK